LVGVGMFRDLIREGHMDEKFMKTYYANNNYWENNFNDVAHGLVVLFEIMIVNNWNLILEGFIVAANNTAYRLYFVCFYAVSVLILINVCVALVLDAFITKYSRVAQAKRSGEFNILHELDAENREALTNALREYAAKHPEDFEYADVDEEDETQVNRILDTRKSPEELENGHDTPVFQEVDASEMGQNQALHQMKDDSPVNIDTERGEGGVNPIQPKSRKLWKIVLKRRTQRLYKVIFDSKA